MTFEADPDLPQLVRCADATLGWGIKNPDGNYAFAALDGTATYRLTGNLGMARHIDLQLHEAHFCEAPNFRVIASAKRKDLDTGPHGEIEIFISPHEQRGNWLRSRPGTPR